MAADPKPGAPYAGMLTESRAGGMAEPAAMGGAISLIPAIAGQIGEWDALRLALPWLHRRHPAALWLRNRTRSKTASAYAAHLRDFARWHGGDPLIGVDIERMIEYRDYLRGLGLRTSTIQTRLRALSSLYGWLAAQGMTDHNPVAGLDLPHEADAKPKRAWTIDEIAAWRAAIPSRPAVLAARDRAWFNVLARNGLRESELLGANVGDLALEGKDPVLHLREHDGRQTIKRGQARLTILKSETWDDLQRYLSLRGFAGEAGELEAPYREYPEIPWREAPLFVSSRGLAGRSGRRARDPYGRLGVSQMSKRLLAIGRRAGLDRMILHPHALRGTFTTTLIELGIPLGDIALATGHRDLRSINAYWLAQMQRARHAARNIPY